MTLPTERGVLFKRVRWKDGLMPATSTGQFDECSKAPSDEVPIHCRHWYGESFCCWCGNPAYGREPTEGGDPEEWADAIRAITLGIDESPSTEGGDMSLDGLAEALGLLIRADVLRLDGDVPYGDDWFIAEVRPDVLFRCRELDAL